MPTPAAIVVTLDDHEQARERGTAAQHEQSEDALSHGHLRIGVERVPQHMRRHAIVETAPRRDAADHLMCPVAFSRGRGG